MTKKDLAKKILDYVEKQEGHENNEWYCTRKEMAAAVLLDLAKELRLDGGTIAKLELET